ncbi:MAG: DUF1385 domain-containing protein [Clostridia bacterium]|nr:DUF1385 domain-containing protein [Clostridia bacterium]
MENKKEEKNPRLGQVGGQAILEGIMMRSGEDVAISVRAMDGTVRSKTTKFVSARKKHKFCALPLIRGVVSFVESLKLSFSTINDGVDMLGIEEEETKFEKWLKEKFGADLMTVLMPVSMILALFFSVALFFFLPSLFGGWIAKLFGSNIGIWQSAIEGVLKVGIFVGYMLLISLMPDIRRTFEYHGAEHKSIFCYESGEELTVENVRKHSRFHPRCGTSFMFVMIFINIVIGFLIPFQNPFLRTACRLLLLPLTMGVGFEFLMVAGKHDNLLIRILSAPGLWMQRITTREPDDTQIEVAIKSLKLAMPEVFPDEEMLAPDPKPEVSEQTEEKANEKSAEA